MTLPEILKAVRQWWWILVICPLIAAATAYFITSTITPVYQAEARLLVEHQMAGGTLDLQSIQAAERRTQTFSQLITTRSVLNPVVEELNLEKTADDLRANLSISHVGDTQLITIAYSDYDPVHAAEVANTVSEKFAEYVRDIQAPIIGVPAEDLTGVIADLETQIESNEARIAEIEAGDGPTTQAEQDELAQLQASTAQLSQSRDAFQVIESSVNDLDTATGSQVFIAEPAAAPGAPISPSLMINLAIAGLLGVLIGGAITVSLSWLDDNVKTEQDVRQLINRPVIGTVPDQDLPDQMESIHASKSISGEVFRGLRTNLQFTMVDRNIKSIVVTSTQPGEGKTTVAANLAIVLAQGGQRVILVDADMRRPKVHNMFHKVTNERGLSNLLLQSPAVIENVVQSTTIDRLKVLSTGPVPPNPPDLYGSARMKALVSALEDSADIVVFDSPPLALSESLLLASVVDGILFVIRANLTRTADIAQGIETVEQTGVPILGVVLNGVPQDSQSAHRVYQQYYPLVSGEMSMPAPKRRLGWLSRVFSRTT